ncbi:MAG: hypothetical protein GDA39_10360, partial [Hyphomonadaceae bacterium]|nr:hypothetical protein [Hyphomonadaceae bacterium]
MGSFADNTYTAPVVNEDTMDMCTATATDATGNEGTAELTVSIAVPDTTPPVVTFSGALVFVRSGSIITLRLTATDNVDGTIIPTVTCTLGSFDVAANTYTAPVSRVSGTGRCTATATDTAGNEGTGRFNISFTGDSEAPELSFSPSTLTVSSGATVASTLTATDNIDGTITPTVTCDAGSFANNMYTAPVVSEDTMATCTATASDAAGNEGTAMLTVSIVPDTTPPVVTFSFAPGTLDNVASGETAALTVRATDNVDGTITPTVTCDEGSFANNMYTAPVVSGDTMDTCTAAAKDAAGNQGTATLTVSVAKETVAPDVSFSPASLTVVSGGTGSSTLTATDNLDDMVTPTVICDAGSFANNTYTAPAVSEDTRATCLATATDAAGNEGTAALTISIAVPDTEPPLLTFTPATLAVNSGGEGSLTLTATDNLDDTVTPTVMCTDGGSFNMETNTYTAPDVDADTTATCTATATDAAGNAGTATLTVTVTAPDTESPVLTFTPDALTVASGGTVKSTFTATDNVGVTSGPVLSCTHGSFSVDTDTYTAPDVDVDTIAQCTAAATDAAGNSGTATLTVTITVPDTEPPVLAFTPETLDDVASGATVASTLTATDNADSTITPTVTCTQGSFANNTYTAPVVSADTTATCTATASDAAGNAAEPVTLTISVAKETVAPDVSFSPATLTVNSGGTGSSTLTATDNVGVVTGPDVTCDAGSFANNTYTAPDVS